jgi:hypothetical protein
MKMIILFLAAIHIASPSSAQNIDLSWLNPVLTYPSPDSTSVPEPHSVSRNSRVIK